MAVYVAGQSLARLQRAMVFIDGTNLLYRLERAKLIVPRLSKLFTTLFFVTGGRELVRIYLYSIQKHIEAARQRHGAECFEEIRVVLGDGVPTSGGNVKEKGVDALLVADLIYHAASRNCDYAVLVSTDTDFAYAIKRVEDFGCRTAVAAVCAEPPDRLKQSSDRNFAITAEQILNENIGRST